MFNAPCGRAGENKVIFPSSTTASIAVGTDGPVSGIENDETPSYGGRSLNGESASTSDAEIVTAFGGGGVAAVPCEAPITVPLLTAMYTPVTVLMEETEKLL